MPIRKPKPTSPGRRFVTYRRLRGDHEDGAGEVAHRGPEEERRPQRQRPQDRPPSRRRRQAAVPHHRLQAPQGRDPRPRGRDRVRPQPLGVHRAAALRRRREGVHPRAEPAARRHDRRVRPAGRHHRRQRAAAGQHAGRHRGPQRRAPAGARRPARPLGRRRRPADGEGGRLRHPAPAVRRDAHGARPSAARRSGRSATPTTRTSPSARPAASATWACARRRAAPP